MCYNVAGLAYAKFKKAVRQYTDEETIDELWQEYERLRKIYEMPEYFQNGFNYGPLYMVREDILNPPDVANWGYAPPHLATVDDLKAFRKKYTTLNARKETIGTSRMYKKIRHKRCVIPVDGFYEYHHKNSKEKVPFFIHQKDEKAIFLAGLWSEWVDRATGEVHYSTTIITTTPNSVMEKLHNNPKAKSGPRMPAIIQYDNIAQWLSDADQEDAEQLLIPFPTEELIYRPVRKLIGKNGTGNTEEAQMEDTDVSLTFEL